MFESNKVHLFTPLHSRQVGRIVRKLVYIRRVQGAALMEMFRSASGGWKETFTTAQLSDYEIA
jgi:hypothetical protein